MEMDIIILAIIVIAILIGIIKGLFNVVYDAVSFVILLTAIIWLTSLIGGVILSIGNLHMRLTSMAAGWFEGSNIQGIESYVASAIIYVIVAIILLIGLSIANNILGNFLNRIIHKVIPVWLDRLLGAVLVAFVAYVVVSALIGLLQFIPHDIFAESQLPIYEYINQTSIGKFLFDNNFVGKIMYKDYLTLEEIIRLLISNISA